MSDALGPVTIGESGGEVFLGASLQDLGSIGPSTLDLVDREVERLVGDAEARPAHVLQLNWDSVRETADALVEHGTLCGVAARGGALHRLANRDDRARRGGAHRTQ